MKKHNQTNKMLFYFITETKIEKQIISTSVFNRRKEKVLIWKEDKSGSPELLLEVRQLVSQNESSRIMSSFVLDKNFYNAYDLNFCSAVLLPNNSSAKEIGFVLNHVKIHCFQSCINFLEIDYTVDSDEPEVINNFNYFMSEVKENIIVKLTYKRFGSDNKSILYTKELTVLNWILNIVKDFGPLHDMDFNSEISYKSLKPLLISYLYSDKNFELESNLGYNYKKSYNLNKAYLRTTKYFNNSTWYYSTDCIANISHSTDNALTNSFFEKNFFAKIERLYLPLVLLAFHMKLFCLYTYHKLSMIDITFSDVTELKSKCDELTVEKASFDKMCLFYCFGSPSFIEHVNVFFFNVVEAFNVDSYKKMVSSKFDFLIDFSSECSKLLVGYDEKKEERRRVCYDIFAIFTASIVSFASLYDTFLKFLKNAEISFNPVENLLFFGLFSIICLFIPLVFNFKKNTKKLKKIKKDISEVGKRIEDIGKGNSF